MVDYMATFKASFARVSDQARQREFFDRFYQRFMAFSPDVAAKFEGTDFARQKEMLRESLVEMMDFCLSLESNPYIVTLARIHGVRGRDIPDAMYDAWLECLVETVREVDPEHNDNVELAWRIVMAPGLEFMKFYRDR